MNEFDNARLVNQTSRAKSIHEIVPEIPTNPMKRKIVTACGETLLGRTINNLARHQGVSHDSLRP